MYTDRQFMIFQTSELPSLDFSQVLETSEETARKSVDGLKTFVKWDAESVPPSVEALTTKEGPYTYDEMLQILATPEWTDPNPMP
jgi:hypothetical protein